MPKRQTFTLTARLQTNPEPGDNKSDAGELARILKGALEHYTLSVPEILVTETTVPDCEVTTNCGWEGIVYVTPKSAALADRGRAGFSACREHAAAFRRMPDRFLVIDTGKPNARATP